MAQDPERDDEALGSGDVDISPDLNMVTLFSSSNIDAELEASNIHAMLEASGVPSVIIGPSMLPSLEFQVQTPRAYVDQAARLLEEARAAGPDAAAEAEAASEESL